MKRMLWVCLLVFGLVLSWTVVYAADFYVIPTIRKNFVPPAKTGQKDCYHDDGTPGTCICGTENCPSGQDGDVQAGLAWPNPRFTDNGNGTVTDNLTGLIWLKNWNCTAFYSGDATGENKRPWGEALTAANSLATGYCGLNDGSSPGDWRLPNINELNSLVDRSHYDPALSNAEGTGQWLEGDAFEGVLSAIYFSSSSMMSDLSSWPRALVVNFTTGNISSADADDTYYVAPLGAIGPQYYIEP